MHQVQIDAVGPPEVLHLVEVPSPAPGPGEVLVRAEAIGITFIETQIRAGRSPRPGAEPLALPAVLGNGVEGTVVEVGTGVDPALMGTRVVTATGGMGGYATEVVVPAADPIPVPAGLAPGEAVALLADGRTALGLVRAAELGSSDRVVVTAAAGGVGSLLVQLACASGVATVVALASSPEKLAVARDLGADVTIDYTADGWSEALRSAIGTADVVFDGVSGATAAELLPLLADDGRYVAFGAAGGSFADTSAAVERGVRVVPGFAAVRGPEDNRALVLDALERAAAGTLRPTIGQRLPLAEAARAHADLEARRTTGKTILLP